MASGQIEELVVNYDREPLARTVERAADLVQAWGLDGTRLAERAARNADGRDNSPGGPTGRTPTRRLGADGPTRCPLVVSLKFGAQGMVPLR